jgi:kynurenine formamidase
MRTVLRYAVAGVIGTFSLLGGSLAKADEVPVNDKPLTEHWWPTEWGADDKVGAPNRTTPAIVLQALKLVKQGKVATLGKLYMNDMINFGERTWKLTIPGTPTGGPFGKNALVYHDELLTTEIGQVGTQFDGPGHIGVHTSKGNYMYNGRLTDTLYERGRGGRVLGMGNAGVEFVGEKGFVCRGILLDAVTYKGGGKRLPIPKKPGDPGIITAADVQNILKQEGVAEPQEGDCVFLYTGHGDLWLNEEWKKLSREERQKRREEFTSGEPGFGVSGCTWLATKKIIMTGCDTSACDAQPGGEEEGYAVPCHTEMQPRRGIWNLENLEFTQLLKDKVHEFLFVWAPLKMVGATGSPANPIALY